MRGAAPVGSAALSSIAALTVAGSANGAPLRAADTAITADIRVELDLPSEQGPMPAVFEVLDVPVNDSVEMPSGLTPISNPAPWSGDLAVDIAADLSSMTLDASSNPNFFEEVYVRVTLHGATWGEFDGVDNALFSAALGAKAELNGSGAGNGALGSMIKLDYPLFPDLQTTSISGSEFTSYWRGADSAYMNGTATFYFAAPGATPVEAEPDFTG